MVDVATASVALVPNAQGFGSALSRQAGPQIGRSGTAMGAGLGKSLLKGFIAIGIGVKVAEFLGSSVAEARESQKVAATTEQIIKSTGQSAKISAGYVGALANSISRKTGIDDEQIQASQNLLLTFKKVRDEFGKDNDIFTRATHALVDLSATGFGDTDSAAKQLGKALNDPVKGIAALNKAGVTFTQQQQDQIKALVDNGQALKAQKIILKEVESQVGGVAEAQATAGEKAKVAFDNIKEQVGTALLPAIDAVENAFTNKVAPAISKFITNLQSGKGAAGDIGNFIRNQLVPAFGQFVDFVQAKVIPLLQEYITWVVTKVVPALRDALVPWIQRGKAAFNQIAGAIQRNKPELIQLFNAFKKVIAFLDTQVIPKILKVASVVLPILGAQIENTINFIGFLVRAFNKVKDVIESVIGFFTRLATAARQKVGNVISYVKALPGKIKSAVGDLGHLLFDAGKAVIQGLLDGIQSMIGKVEGALKHLTDLIPKVKGPPAKDKTLLYESGQLIIEGLIDGITSKEAALTKKLKDLTTKIKDSLKSLRSDFASLVDPIASAFTSDLFSAESASQFVTDLLGTKGTLSKLSDAFKTLIKQGLNPKFLYDLFQSGNAGLILDLAANPALASQAGSLFGDINQLSTELGQSVAGATPEGKAIQNQTARLEKKLDQLIHHVDRIAPDTGREINGAASNGRRRAA